MQRKHFIALLVVLIIIPTLVFAFGDDKGVDAPEGNTTYDELVKIIGTNEERNYAYWYTNESLNTSGQDKGVSPKGFEIRDICDNLFSQAGQGEGGFVLVPSKTVDVGALAPHHLI